MRSEDFSYRDLFLAPRELPCSWEVGGVSGNLLEHPVGVVHLLLLDLLVEEALVVEAMLLFDVIHSGCHLTTWRYDRHSWMFQDPTRVVKFIDFSCLSHGAKTRALGMEGSPSHWTFWHSLEQRQKISQQQIAEKHSSIATWAAPSWQRDGSLARGPGEARVWLAPWIWGFEILFRFNLFLTDLTDNWTVFPVSLQ